MMLPCRHRYMPCAEAATGPNIVIDGALNDNAVLSLSHWPKSGTPWPLKADTSVAIVFNYLNSQEWHRDVEVVTNDHFDEDGLIGLFCMIEPDFALQHRDLLIDASEAGDFGIYWDRRAARIGRPDTVTLESQRHLTRCIRQLCDLLCRCIQPVAGTAQGDRRGRRWPPATVG
jgi:hypothetical protein